MSYLTPVITLVTSGELAERSEAAVSIFSIALEQSPLTSTSKLLTGALCSVPQEACYDLVFVIENVCVLLKICSLQTFL